MSINKEKQQGSIDALKSFRVKEGTEIYSLVTKVAPSGMTRHIKFFITISQKTREPVIIDITYAVANATQIGTFTKDRTFRISGCGMDMCFHTVYELGRVMFPSGSKTHITGRNGDTTPEKDGGYLLKSVNLN